MSRKQGHWIDHGTIKNYPQEGFNNYHLLVCSECGCMHRTRLQDGVGKPFNANYCPNCGAIMIEPKPQTNADRIRNMTDEELAEFLDKSLNLDREDCDPIGCYGCVYYGTHHQDKDGGCYECGDCEFEGGLLKWLQAEVKEGVDNG